MKKQLSHKEYTDIVKGISNQYNKYLDSAEDVDIDEELSKEFAILADANDEELSHSLLDDALCELLKELGFSKVVDVFENSPKWYA